MADVDLGRCAQLGTVASTVASASYANAMLQLALSAKKAGFPCLAVQPYDNFAELHEQPDLLLPLPLPPRQLLPRPIWCSSEYTGARSPAGQAVASGWYGWRRSHLYRVLMWVNVLSRGFHLLAVDLDWRFLDRSPLPEISALRAANGSPVDVLNWWDGPRERTVNVGLMWIRSSPGALALARRVQNRTFASWEQGLFTEELQYRYAHLSCCHCNALMSTWFNRSWKDHRGKVTASTVSKKKKRMAKSLAAARFEREGRPRCAADPPPGDYPPNASTWNWDASGWLPNAYNYAARRYYGRCTGAADCTCTYTPTRQAGNGKMKRILGRSSHIDAFKAEVRSPGGNYSSAR